MLLSRSKPPHARARYLIPLKAPLTVVGIRQIPGLPPHKFHQDEENPNLYFVTVDAGGRDVILAHFAPVRPFYIALPISVDKNLLSTGLGPTLAVDATMPQNRLEPDVIASGGSRTSQNEYPVPYFFYG
jgi:hypothetical protein